jgi:hypothetical protein
MRSIHPVFNRRATGERRRPSPTQASAREPLSSGQAISLCRTPYRADPGSGSAPPSQPRDRVVQVLPLPSRSFDVLSTIEFYANSPAAPNRKRVLNIRGYLGDRRFHRRPGAFGGLSKMWPMLITYICRPRSSWVESMDTVLPSRLNLGCKSTRCRPLPAVDLNLASGTNCLVAL